MKMYLRVLCSAVVLSVFCFSKPVHAISSIETIGGGEVHELAHKLEFEVGRHGVDIKETITLSNALRGRAEAVLRFDMPARAAIHDLRIETFDGRKRVSAVVGFEASSTLLKGRAVGARPDTGLLRMVSTEGDGEDDVSSYELRIYPVTRDRNIEVQLRWQIPVRMVSDRLQIHLPSRGAAAALARSEVILTVPDSFRELYSGGAALGQGTKVGKTRKYGFFAPVGELMIEVDTGLLNTGIRTTAALYPLSKTTGIAAVQVVMPAGIKETVPVFERVLVLVDSSQSINSQGATAAALLVDTLLTQLGENVSVEVISYARKSKRLFGKWKKIDRLVRREITRSIQGSKRENGSRLDRALTRAGKILGPLSAQKEKTLLVIVTDRLQPTTQTYRELESSLGFNNMAHTRILAAVLVPPDRPLPRENQGALSTFAHAGGGRLVSIRYDQIYSHGSTLLASLRQPIAVTALEVKLDQGVFVGAQFPARLVGGESVAAFGFYKHGVPKHVVVSGVQAGKRIELSAMLLHGKDMVRLARIGLSTTSADGFPGTEDEETRSKHFRSASVKLATVTQRSALVVVDAKDGFARDRLAFAAKWGGEFYRRMPPPPERIDAEFKGFSYASRWQREQRVLGGGRTGELDKNLVLRLIRAHVIPVARNCYEKQLGREPTLAGEVMIRFEVARGEIMDVRLTEKMGSLGSIKTCIIDAVYAIPFPKVRQGASREMIYVAKYPLRFRRSQQGKAKIQGGSFVEPTPESTDPLWGLPE